MHGIMRHDRGMVQGTSTWHGLPQYQVIPDRPITIMEALEIADYPIELAPLYWMDAGHEYHSASGAFAIVRPDTQSVLVPAVGSRFATVDNKHMVNIINEKLLAMYPELVVESVGTLFNGATFFINLRVGEFRVRGDQSDTLTNIMFANPLGRGRYVSCAHNTRVVCNNTERVAESQGVMNGAIKKFRHTAGAEGKIGDHMIELAALKLHLQRHQDTLNYFADTEVSVAEVDTFLDMFFKIPEDDGRAKTMATNAREGFMSILEGKQMRETLDTPYTKYGLYMAYTDWVDHNKQSRGMDKASIMLDGIVGTRAKSKQEVFNALIA